jgi:solute:Na+ symporter, SSS family
MKFEPNAVSITIFCALFLLVTVLGFVTARWKRSDLDLLDEWGLGGRRFGTVITWFLLGGDLFTAYTFIAVPALVFAIGAGGFFALPYTGLVALLLNVAVTSLVTLLLGGRDRADELDETREVDYDELRETHEPAPTAGAGVA